MLRLVNGEISARPTFLPEVLRNVGGIQPHFSWICANKTCVGYRSYDNYTMNIATAETVTKLYNVMECTEGLWCQVISVSSAKCEGHDVNWRFFTSTVFNTRGTAAAPRVNVYDSHGCFRQVTSTWRHAMLRLKHVLRVRARRRLALRVCDVSGGALDVSFVIAGYIV